MGNGYIGITAVPGNNTFVLYEYLDLFATLLVILNENYMTK
jgi:hypothetical protein